MSSSSESDDEDPRTADVAPVAQELLDDELSAATMAALQAHLVQAEESSDSDEDEPAVTPVSSPNARGKTAFAPPKHFNLGPKDPRKLGISFSGAGRGGQQRSMVSRPKNSGGMPKAARASDVSYTR